MIWKTFKLSVENKSLKNECNEKNIEQRGSNVRKKTSLEYDRRNAWLIYNFGAKQHYVLRFQNY
jgi:hypothetical protein